MVQTNRYTRHNVNCNRSRWVDCQRKFYLQQPINTSYYKENFRSKSLLIFEIKQNKHIEIFIVQEIYRHNESSYLNFQQFMDYVGEQKMVIEQLLITNIIEI